MSTTTVNGSTIAPNSLVAIPRPDIQRVQFTLVGTSGLISHAWSKKAKDQMLGKQMKKATTGKEAKDPEQDYLDSLYPLPGFTFSKGTPVPANSCGFPAVAFKAAMVRAGTYTDGLKMTFLRGAFHVNGELVPILADTPEMREDMVRVGMGTADIRYRGEFAPWRVELPIDFNARVISPEQLANLLQIAGFSVGVGEWRPEKDGSHGMWTIS